MQSGRKESILNLTQKIIIGLFFILTITSLIVFKNIYFQPTLILKSFGDLSIDPEIAFENNKPTFLEFYAEWCEVCKEMAPKISALKDEYQNDINFVFLNVDNPKWENYIKKYNVNGIPQVNIFNNEGDLKATLIGKQDEKNIKGILRNSISGNISNEKTLNSEYSPIKDNKNYQMSPRSHG